MKSNLKLKSNIYLRDKDKSLEEDKEFVLKIRGVRAIRKMLWSAFEVSPNAGFNSPEILNLFKSNRITKSQWNTLKWEIICYKCQSMPEGRTFAGKVEFRCEIEGCK